MIYANAILFSNLEEIGPCDICGKKLDNNATAYFFQWDKRDDEIVRKALNLESDKDILLVCEDCLWSTIREKIKGRIKIYASGKLIGMFLNGRFIERF